MCNCNVDCRWLRRPNPHVRIRKEPPPELFPPAPLCPGGHPMLARHRIGIETAPRNRPAGTAGLLVPIALAARMKRFAIAFLPAGFRLDANVLLAIIVATHPLARQFLRL